MATKKKMKLPSRAELKKLQAARNAREEEQRKREEANPWEKAKRLLREMDMAFDPIVSELGCYDAEDEESDECQMVNDYDKPRNELLALVNSHCEPEPELE